MGLGVVDVVVVGMAVVVVATELDVVFTPEA